MKAILILFIFLLCAACTDSKAEDDAPDPVEQSDAIELADAVTMADAAVDAANDATPADIPEEVTK
jgi:hypothetical protein